MSEDGDLFDLAKGKETRDKGIAKVSDHNPGWIASCLEGFESFPREQRFTGEDVRRWFTERDLIPKHHNAWGALINTLIKKNKIYKTGEYVQMRNPSSHARVNPVYRHLSTF